MLDKALGVTMMKEHADLHSIRGYLRETSWMLGLLAMGMVNAALASEVKSQGPGDNPAQESQAVSSSDENAASVAGNSESKEPAAEEKQQPADHGAEPAKPKKQQAEASGDQPTGSTEPRELSVPPLETTIYPADRPSWISSQPELEGKVHRWPVYSVPSLNADAAREGLREQARATVKSYIVNYMPEVPSEMVSDELITDELVSKLYDPDRYYEGQMTKADGDWYEAATELVFEPSFRDDVMRLTQRSLVSKRIALLGLGTGAAMVSLASLSTMLRLFGGRSSEK